MNKHEASISEASAFQSTKTVDEYQGVELVKGLGHQHRIDRGLTDSDWENQQTSQIDTSTRGNQSCYLRQNENETIL